jgi:hypothetical protein
MFMKNITEWDHVEWSLAIFFFVIAHMIIDHVAFYVGYGLAVIQVFLSS